MNIGFRFDRSRKLLDSESFRRVFKKSTRSRDNFFTVLAHNKKKTISKLGMAISKKNCRYATNRNRIKRVVREAFRHNQVYLTGLDLVVINQPAARFATNSELKESLKQHFQKCISMKIKLNNQEI
tara:strand:+ start:1589 stop:1966 length:378 start_codon:yes stop_codon:yes gene_type:complete